ncbi:DUF2225 domain-containing protein [bacterium]|nr:DUF2225 domain-containing protein [bacterium]
MALSWLPVLAILLRTTAPVTFDPNERYLEQHEFTSPVNGEAFVAYILKDDVNVIDWDYDRCPHPPLNTLAYALVIDPATGYVAPPDEFEQPTPWEASDLADLLGQPRFKRLAPEGLPWAGAYAWEKLENAALLAQAEDAPAHVIGNWWLLAGWAVRLDVISGTNEFDTRVRELFARFPEQGPDPASLFEPYQLQVARAWEELRNTGQLPELSDADFALAMAWLYRSRGELRGADHWLHMATLGDETLPDSDLLYQYLYSSIDLERHYLGTARRWLVQAWDNGEFNQMQQAGTAFMLAELNRRLGELPAAVFWYNQAEELNMGLLNPDLIAMLRERCSTGVGY